MQANDGSTAEQHMRSSLSGIINVPLTSVAFVMDYVQLLFDYLVFTAYTLLQVLTPEQTLSPSQAGYADALRALIGHAPISVDIRFGDRLAIIFDNHTSISVSLNDVDYTGPEAVMFQNGSGAQIQDWWVI